MGTKAFIHHLLSIFYLIMARRRNECLLFNSQISVDKSFAFQKCCCLQLKLCAVIRLCSFITVWSKSRAFLQLYFSFLGKLFEVRSSNFAINRFMISFIVSGHCFRFELSIVNKTYRLSYRTFAYASNVIFEFDFITSWSYFNFLCISNNLFC